MTLMVVIASLFQHIVEVITKDYRQVFQQKAYRDIALQKEISKQRRLRISTSQVRYLCLYHYVLTTDLFGISATSFREEVKYIRYFAYVEQFQLIFPKVGILQKFSHVTDIPTFNGKDEQNVDIFYNMMRKHVFLLAQTIFKFFAP